MIAGLLEDPDVKEALQNPKVKAAYDDVVANGMMAGMKYFGDPDCAPIIQQIVRRAARMPTALALPLLPLLSLHHANERDMMCLSWNRIGWRQMGKMGLGGGGSGAPPDLNAMLGAFGGQA